MRSLFVDMLTTLADQPKIVPSGAAWERNVRSGSMVSELLRALDELGDLTTTGLARKCKLTSRQVWGLLKVPRSNGQVRYDDGHWSLVREFAGQDIERAATLLRGHGWYVEPPNG